MDDQSCADVQITPSTALEVSKKLTPISLKFKDKEGKFKEVAAWICLDEARSVTVPQKSMLKENRAPSTKVIGSVHNVEDVTASNRAPNKAETTNTDETTPETPAGFTLPLYQFWYMHHAYRKELEQFEKQHGVSICAEVSVSIKHIQRSSPDSVSKTTADFQRLVQRCTDSFTDAAINHNHMDSDIVKQALHHIQSEETKMMVSMSASNCLFFGPKKYTDVIKREVEEMRVESQFNNSRPTRNDMKHQNVIMDRLYLQPEEFWYMHHAYRKELEQFEKQHGVSICAEVSVSIKHIQRSSPDSVSKTTADFQRLVQRCTDSFTDAAINHNHMDSDIVKQALHHIQSEETKMMVSMSASNCLFFGPKKYTDVIKREVEEMRVESQFNNSRPTRNDMKHQNVTMDRLYLQPEEVIGAAGVESPQHSAPHDTASFIIKVDRREPFPEKWKTTLQKAIQVWLSKMEGTASVLRLKLMDDQSCAEVQITPSTALEVLKKHTPISLKFKDKGKFKQVSARICPYEARSVTVPQKSMLKKNRAPSTKVIGSVTSGASEDTNNVEDVANTAGITHETPAVLTVPFFLSWYMHHAYGKEIKQIEKRHGVSICAEMSVLVNSTERSRPDSVSKASDDFYKLVKRCTDGFSDAAINHNHMHSDIVKQALRHIQSEESKMMFTMSASNCLFFGPKKFTDIIKREVEEMRVEGQFNDKSSQIREDKSSLDMDTKELPTQLEMDKVYWDLMKLSYKEQLSQLETKYGVSFNEEKQQKIVTIKVQARSKGVQLINLESHAIRALTQLYQKLVSATVTCELKNPKDETVVGSAVEKLQQKHHCVVAADVSSRWRLVGLPEHLGPAIAEIEKILWKSVFDDKMKKSIGYSGDIPHSRGIKWNQASIDSAVTVQPTSINGQNVPRTGHDHKVDTDVHLLIQDMKDSDAFSVETPQPSAPLDTATFIIKVDWREPFPDRWRATLQKAFQSCLSILKEKASVHSLELMDDQSCAEVQITPSTARAHLAAVYAELLVFVGRASGTLRLPRGRVKKGAAHVRLDERFLSVHKLCSSHNLFHSFLISMSEIGRAWKNP
ncbi:hypothetical protein DPX16_8107 [Anabarilius grahami]|uniref:DTX3L KH-like domain-containing protein n=1 Tax=Anabarilius grahami TaxID=495550 RepID=A0A3N0Y8E6_ANAGA|nr:hypothetical protein DPX16_8107 [Anabarilius grahami]